MEDWAERRLGKNMKKRTIYTATYTQESREAVGGKITFRFLGDKMKQEYDDLDELLKQIEMFKEQWKSKGYKLIEVNVFKHEVEKIMSL